MSRSARLLELVRALRRRRRPASAADLAAELGVSPRTIQRDVAALVEQGAPVEGEAELGYALRSGFFLPALTLSEDEVDAIILGLRFVSQGEDEALGLAADGLLAKIAAVLPPAPATVTRTSASPAEPREPGSAASRLKVIRRALRAEEKLRLRYTDKKGAANERVIWPVAIDLYGDAEVLAAWCETRRDFRHFRLDRIALADPTGERYPARLRILLAEWRLQRDLGGLG